MTQLLPLGERVRLGLYDPAEIETMSKREQQAALQARRKLIRSRLFSEYDDPRTWPDYQAVMMLDIEAQVRQIMPHLLKLWPLLLADMPVVQHMFHLELANRNQTHHKNSTRRENRARLATLKKLSRDLRTLGLFETYVLGKTVYGYPTNRPR